MNWLKKIIDKQIWGSEIVISSDILSANHRERLHALEDYLDIEFFHGDKSKPHYRKKRVIKRPVGRPRKKK